jgi:hypothetical protein
MALHATTRLRVRSMVPAGYGAHTMGRSENPPMIGTLDATWPRCTMC